MADVFLDGKFIGTTKEPENFVNEIRDRRRKGLISSQVNVAYHKHLDEVKILTDSGRVRRPVIIVENGKPKLKEEHIQKLKVGAIKWEDLIANGIIEYVDAEEEENCYIAIKEEELTPEHTHLEIDPALILGFSASFIPYAEFNRGDRV
ncbi:MAG: DNA-directed RNA polymerase subunit B, partial [Candidatus Aenigmatarchaeota archaeon]